MMKFSNRGVVNGAHSTSSSAGTIEALRLAGSCRVSSELITSRAAGSSVSKTIAPLVISKRYIFHAVTAGTVPLQ
jgi:hypothetical protein